MNTVPATEAAKQRAQEHVRKYGSKLYAAEVLDVMCAVNPVTGEPVPEDKRIAQIRFTR